MTEASWESYVDVAVHRAPRSVQVSAPGNVAEELGRAAAPVLRRIEELLTDTSSWLALADPSAVVIYEWASSGHLKRELARADVEAGALLSEAVVGTNGVGTALARRNATVVRGAEHANERWQSLACAASPIVHPLTRQLMGVVNITCLVDDQNPHLRITLTSLVEGIQHGLAARARSRHQRLLDAHLRVVGGAAGPVVTLDAFTMIVEDRFGAVPMDRESLWALVLAAGPLATEVEVQAGHRIRLLPVVPGRNSEGCSLVFGRSIVWAPRQLANESSSRRPGLSPLEQAEFDVITEALLHNAGNKVSTAHHLQISRGTLYQRLRRYGLT
jgi:transcriptional regulator of acetoin/glycerol metabolism